MLFVDKHQTCKRGTLFAQEKNSLDLRASQAGRHGTWFSTPKTSTSALESLADQSLHSQPHAKVFLTAELAPLVPKMALQVRPDQLQGSVSPT